MEIQQPHQNCPTAEEKHHHHHDKGVQHSRQKAQLNINPSPVPSASSSPSHEFSFTVSLHPPHPPSTAGNTKTKSPTPPFSAIDLSPADEIFFHGHLLPLHLLSHLPVSRRSSANSPESFTLPIQELMHDDTDTKHHDDCKNLNPADDHREGKAKRKIKSKSFSTFVMPRKWRSSKGHSTESKEYHHDDDDEREKDGGDEREKRRSRFDLVKRYMRLVKPFLSNIRRRSRREKQDKFLPYSFSGNLGVRNSKTEVMREKRRGDFLSAPASMSNSPTNSGHLVASGTVTPTKSDSTMEELQAAIQAAIAHCKKSIAADDKIIKLP